MVQCGYHRLAGKSLHSKKSGCNGTLMELYGATLKIYTLKIHTWRCTLFVSFLYRCTYWHVFKLITRLLNLAGTKKMKRGGVSKRNLISYLLSRHSFTASTRLFLARDQHHPTFNRWMLFFFLLGSHWRNKLLPHTLPQTLRGCKRSFREPMSLYMASTSFRVAGFGWFASAT